MDSKAFRHILHPTDFSLGDHGAFVHALRMGLAASSRLTLLHVGSRQREAGWSDFPRVRGALRQWGLISEEASAEEVEATGLRLRKALMVAGDPVDGITKYIGDHEPSLVVLATHQRGGWMVRSRSGAIARSARIPALFVPRQIAGFVSPETGQVRLDRILVPVASRPSPAPALRAARAVIQLFSLPETALGCLHAGPAADAPDIQADPSRDGNFEYVQREGPAVDRILEESEARDASLIVMSTEGHHGFMDALRGSTTEQIVRQAKCPVLAVPARDAA